MGRIFDSKNPVMGRHGTIGLHRDHTAKPNALTALTEEGMRSINGRAIQCDGISFAAYLQALAQNFIVFSGPICRTGILPRIP